MKILFVTWDGPQVTYLESLFLPIFSSLGEAGFDFHVLQFTWGDEDRIEANRRACASAGFGYQANRVWRRPLAAGSLLSAIRGASQIRWTVRKYGIDAVLPRSTLPALATLIAFQNSQLPIIFDADGLGLDERVEFAGQSPSSLAHRLLRDVEAQAVRRSSLVLTRSSKASEILLARAGAGTDPGKFHVVSNGRDARIFTPNGIHARRQIRIELGLSENAPLLAYAGSIGQQYCLHEMIQLLAHVRRRRSDAHLLILTGAPELVKRVMSAQADLALACTVISVAPRRVATYLGCADLGLALRRPSFSMQGVAPIKLGEYLLCGLPVVATAGIGDTSALSAGSGFLLQKNSDEELTIAADWFIDCVLAERDVYRMRARAAGLERFSLEASKRSYEDALRRVVQPSPSVAVTQSSNYG